MVLSSRMLLALALLAPLAVKAETPESAHNFAFTGWLVSDYVFRGVSQNYEDPALQAAVDYTHSSGFYAGAWASPVDFNNDSGADLEVDTYVGFKRQLNDVLTGDIQFIRYNYPGVKNGFHLAYNEFIGKLTFFERVVLTVGYSTDVFASGKSGLYTNLTGNWRLPYELTLSTGVGLYRFDSDLFPTKDEYLDYSVGLSRAFGKLETALTYVDTDNNGPVLFGKIADSRVVLSLKYAF